MGETAKHCRNCHSRLTGEYCANCGQREGRADQRFLDLAGELTGDLFDLDSRIWRTLFSLLFRPGHLSAEFIAGRRARYLPPLRLYLVISFILFLTISMSNQTPLEVQAVASVPAGDEAPAATVDLADDNSPQWLKDMDRRLGEKAGILRENPGALTEGMLEYMPQLMFLLLPLFALLIQFAYLFSGFHYLQHLVFALHFHSYTYLVYLLAMAVEFFGYPVQNWVFVAAIIYLPLALRRTYGSDWRGAASKSVFICFSYAIMLALGFAAVAMVALFML